MPDKKIFTIEDYLRTSGSIIYKIVGKSMMPMLVPNKDLVTIISMRDIIVEENDVVLYKRSNKLILHRIVRVDQDGNYTLLGDNCSRKEFGICSKDIIGVLVSFTHNGKKYYRNDPKYLNYIVRLRSVEGIRMRRKFVYDLMLKFFDFLPEISYLKLKRILSGILYEIRFE